MKRSIFGNNMDTLYFCSVFLISIKMKKIVLVLLVGLLMTPSKMFADKYNSKRVVPADSPIRSSGQSCINLYLDYYTGELYIRPNYDYIGLNINLTGDGVTYIDTTISLNAGQTFTDCLDYLDEGTYTLTFSNNNGVIDQYIIVVEKD